MKPPQYLPLPSSAKRQSGKAAKITIGTASSGNPAEALLLDDFNQKHYIMVEPEFEKEYLPKGTEVVIVEKLNGTWLAIPFK
ncbi:OB-fold-containig protein [Moritella sp.]|uniref:OB-fold-containig protein n=1 Tax=Moritella sp. TaxID=78556 RepID=UPI001E194112|nr:DUF1449 family protein [Moritella sp.]